MECHREAVVNRAVLAVLRSRELAAPVDQPNLPPGIYSAVAAPAPQGHILCRKTGKHVREKGGKEHWVHKNAASKFNVRQFSQHGLAADRAAHGVGGQKAGPSQWEEGSHHRAAIGDQRLNTSSGHTIITLKHGHGRQPKTGHKDHQTKTRCR